MKTCFINNKYLNEKNITYQYTVNQVKVFEAIRDNKTTCLMNICEEVTDGTRVKREYLDNGVKIINISDIKDDEIYPYSLKCISKGGIREQDYVKEGDILITAIGRSGKVAMVPYKLQDSVISSDIIKIRLKDEIKSKSIFMFLQSQVGACALDALKIGNLNRISVRDIKEMVVPIDYVDPNIGDENIINNNQKANKIFEECVEIFDEFVPQNNINYKMNNKIYINTKNIDLDRLDAQHYIYFGSDLYKLIQRNTSNIQWQSLKEVVEIKRAERPKMEDDDFINYINLSNVDSDLSVIKNCNNDKTKNLSSRIRYVLNENDVITAKSGSATGTKNHISAVITERYAAMMASDAFYNMKPMKINPYYLMFLFKQTIILKQIETITIGQYFKTIARIDFEGIKVPRIACEDEISEKMKAYVKCLEEFYIKKMEGQ